MPQALDEWLTQRSAIAGPEQPATATVGNVCTDQPDHIRDGALAQLSTVAHAHADPTAAAAST